MAEDNKPFIEEVKDYIKVEIDILKINLLEKISKLMTFVIGIVLAAIMATVAIAYFSVMLFNLFNQMTNSVFWATIIMIVLFIALSIMIIAFSERLFLNFFIKKVYKLLFQSNDNLTDKTTDDEKNHNNNTLQQ
ncbi:MAG: hypothetical protein D8B59_00095 [Bacteroidetes bacterium]|jgi:hypothetical protein|nr:MAG: hypothetical protein D8B59_00095 [Bacteroidota bacterium]